MDSSTPEENGESKAIITAQQYSQEIRKSPALPPLSNEDMHRASEMTKSLIRSEDGLDNIVTFGSDAQAAMAKITKDMLSGVRIKTMDEVISLSDGVLAELKTLDVRDLTPSARRILFVIPETIAAIKNRIDNFFRRMELVNARLDRQEADIFAKETASTERYYRDTDLAKSTLGILLDASIKRMAIKIFLDGEHGYAELQNRQLALAEETESAKTENRSVDYLMIAKADRYAKYIERLEGKDVALEQARLFAYQTNITIRMMRENEIVIRQKLSDIRTDLLPQWRTHLAIAYSAYQQRGIAKFVADLAEAEIALRRKVADGLEQTADEVANLMTRPIIDVESVRYYNDKLIKSFDTLKAASIEAKKIRDAAEKEMHGLISQLGEAAVSASVDMKKPT